MSSWLDPYLDSLAGKLGLRKSNAGFMADAMAQDPGAERQADRYEATARRTDPTYGPEIMRQMALEKPYAAPVVHGPEAVKKMPQPTVHLPPIQMQRDVPELPTQPLTAYDVQRGGQDARDLSLFNRFDGQPSEYHRPDAFTRGEDIIQLISDAEGRAGIKSDPSGSTDSTGTTRYSTAANGGSPMTEDEVLEYLYFLEGR